MRVYATGRSRAWGVLVAGLAAMGLVLVSHLTVKRTHRG